ncbi:hypothetical protein LL240_09615 [Oceanimonas baumannii]|uniref:hypothetical protein n=1 Tax=Oceanimonas baumannii TaxID=129578 RepID=UPI001D17F6CB|nr:hypothetical protein [Oceanimonas baumannii]MCC4264712.1 hypothetical protein [Oceanimonas baumannii]
MQWTEVAPEKWMPFDLLNNEIHQCPSKNVDKWTRDEVLQHLQDLGFEAYIPRTSSWKYCFISSNKSQTIYFLVGKRGIDFKLYDRVRETKVDDKGKIFTDGGEMVRNYYRESDVNVHELVLEIASRLVTNTPIDESFMSGHGKSWQEQKTEYIRSLPKSAAAEARDEMIEIYDAISTGDGEDAYLGDGIWISSDGSLDDRGR